MTLDDIILNVKVRSAGRTHFAGMELPWEEVLVAEIERLREALAEAENRIDTLE